jgi:cold shock CspA family protein
MSDEHEIQHGVVTYWNGRYGFIRSDAVGPDLFTHISNLPEGATVERGARVTFKTVRGDLVATTAAFVFLALVLLFAR